MITTNTNEAALFISPSKANFFAERVLDGMPGGGAYCASISPHREGDTLGWRVGITRGGTFLGWVAEAEDGGPLEMRVA